MRNHRYIYWCRAILLVLVGAIFGCNYPAASVKEVGTTTTVASPVSTQKKTFSSKERHISFDYPADYEVHEYGRDGDYSFIIRKLVYPKDIYSAIQGDEIALITYRDLSLEAAIDAFKNRIGTEIEAPGARFVATLDESKFDLDGKLVIRYGGYPEAASSTLFLPNPKNSQSTIEFVWNGVPGQELMDSIKLTE